MNRERDQVIQEGEQRIVIFPVDHQGFSEGVWSARDRHHGSRGSSDLRPWVVVFPFGVKERGFHEDQVGFPRRWIGDDADGVVPVQERPSLFRSRITIVVGVAVLITIID